MAEDMQSISLEYAADKIVCSRSIASDIIIAVNVLTCQPQLHSEKLADDQEKSMKLVKENLPLDIVGES